jgi:ribosomal protein S18 acetylase RimI-like enzyme
MAEPRFFSHDYLEHAVLRDGTQVAVRLVRPEDRELLRAGFDRLSPESRYARFLAPKASLSDDELRYLCEVDQENHVALGAVRDAPDGAPDGEPIGLGIARFIRLTDRPDTAEAAIAVADEVQHQGLGRLLLTRLVAAAAERGIARFRCEVLGSNTGMTALLGEISPDRSIEARAGVMSIEVTLPSAPPTQPPAGPLLHSPIYRLFRAAAQNAVEWTEAVRRLWRH